jgi:hypothetical protein
MHRGDWVQAGRHVVQVEDARDGKVMLNGKWAPAGGVRLLSPFEQARMNARERQRWERIERDTARLVRKVLRLINELDASYGRGTP